MASCFHQVTEISIKFPTMYGHLKQKSMGQKPTTHTSKMSLVECDYYNKESFLSIRPVKTEMLKRL